MHEKFLEMSEKISNLVASQCLLVVMVKSCGLLQSDLGESCESSVSAVCCQHCSACAHTCYKIPTELEPVAVHYSNPAFGCKERIPAAT